MPQRKTVSDPSVKPQGIVSRQKVEQLPGVMFILITSMAGDLPPQIRMALPLLLSQIRESLATPYSVEAHVAVEQLVLWLVDNDIRRLDPKDRAEDVCCGDDGERKELCSASSSAPFPPKGNL